MTAAATPRKEPIRAVLWDFGGVILESPFDAFRRYERDRGLPDGFLRRLNATDPDTNAWAKLERGQLTVDEFCVQYGAEARAAGGVVDARQVLALLSGAVRPAMVEAIRRCRRHGLLNGLLTNNFVGLDEGSRRAEMREVLSLFEVILESSRAGCRKPDPRFYELACEALDIEPNQAVFLDDLGINLKPARAMGMATIKVTDPATALNELANVVGLTFG